MLTSSNQRAWMTVVKLVTAIVFIGGMIALLIMRS